MKKISVLFISLMLILLVSCTSSSDLSTKTFYLTFNPNGGELPMDEASIWQVQGGSLVNLPEPIKEGKTFTGWIGTHGLVLNPNNYLVTSDETFTAAYDSYDITYLGRDGSIIEVKTINANDSYTKNDKVLPNEVTEEEYYSFIGWGDEDIPSKINKDYTVASIWQSEGYEKTTLFLESWLLGKDDYEFDIYIRDTLITTTFPDNYEMACLAFGLAFSSSYISVMDDFYQGLAFDNIYYSPDYYLVPTTKTCCFTFGHKKLDSGIDLINVTIPGSYPDIEWVNNFEIGSEGLASGYLYQANRIKTQLETYLTNYEASNVLLLINGYSRGGGIAQILSYLLNSDASFVLPPEKHQTITFESPRPVDFISDDVTNCINYYMDGDIVASVSPKEFGLYHYGIERPVTADPSTFTNLVDPEITLPEFNPNKGLYETQSEYLDYFWSIVTSNQYEDEIGLNSREAYYTYNQDMVSYFIGLYADASYRTISKLESSITSMGVEEIKKTFMDVNKLKNFIYPILEADIYLDIDEAELTSYLAQVVKIVKDGPGARLATTIFLNSNNIIRCGIYHFPEIIFGYLYYSYLEECGYLK